VGVPPPHTYFDTERQQYRYLPLEDNDTPVFLPDMSAQVQSTSNPVNPFPSTSKASTSLAVPENSSNEKLLKAIFSGLLSSSDEEPDVNSQTKVAGKC